MPVYTVYLFLGYWPFGWVACNVWLSMDYALCTASIANLLIIALDRYRLVTQPLEYKASITPKKMGVMIFTAWMFALLVWPPWIFVWPYIEGERTVPNHECYVQFLKSNPVLSTIVSAVSFYIPVTITVVLYVSLYIKNEQRRRRRRRLSTTFSSLHNLTTNKANKKGNGTSYCSMCCSCSVNNSAYNLDNDKGEQSIKVVGKSYQIEIKVESISNLCNCANQSVSGEIEDTNASHNNNTIADENHSKSQTAGAQTYESGSVSSFHEIGITRLSVNKHQLNDALSKISNPNSRINHLVHGHRIQNGSDSRNNKRMVKILSATLLTLIISNAPYYTAAVAGSYCDGCVNMIFYGVGKHLIYTVLCNKTLYNRLTIFYNCLCYWSLST